MPIAGLNPSRALVLKALGAAIRRDEEITRIDGARLRQPGESLFLKLPQ
jgi:hypothetical protein